MTFVYVPAAQMVHAADPWLEVDPIGHRMGSTLGVAHEEPAGHGVQNDAAGADA